MAGKTKPAEAAEAFEGIKARVIQIDPQRCRLLEVNASYMPQETFARLVENVRKDGILSQIPFGWRLHDDSTREPELDEDGEPVYLILSGNHRVMAAREVGLPTIDLQVCDQYLDPKRRVAIQLSHNAISGDDDPAVLRVLYEEIDDVDLKLYSGLDDRVLELMKAVETLPLSEAHLVMQTLTMTFLPDEIEFLNEAFKRARKDAPAAWHLLTRMSEYDRALDALEQGAGSEGVRNIAVGLLVVLEVFERHLDDLMTIAVDEETGKPRDKKRLLPAASVMGTDLVPAQRLINIQNAIRAVQKDASESPWAVVERWANAALSERKEV